jgi:hypothetical protein
MGSKYLYPLRCGLKHKIKKFSLHFLIFRKMTKEIEYSNENKARKISGLVGEE